MQQSINFVTSYADQTKEVNEALQSIDVEIQSVYTKLAELQEAKAKVLRRTPIECPTCKVISQIGSMVYFQTHFYISPRGCTDGDYWSRGEGQTECPSCKTRLRLYNAPALEALKAFFFRAEDEYKDWS